MTLLVEYPSQDADNARDCGAGSNFREVPLEQRAHVCPLVAGKQVLEGDHETWKAVDSSKEDKRLH